MACANIIGNRRSDLLFILKLSSIIHYRLWMLVEYSFLVLLLLWYDFLLFALYSYFCADDEGVLSDNRVMHQYKLTYYNKLGQSARPIGRSLHQRTEKIRELQLNHYC